MSESHKYLYTDGSQAQIGDRVRFRKAYGYAGQHTMETDGVIKSWSYPSHVVIDISPRTYMHDMGRFGTERTSLFTLFTNWDSSKQAYMMAKPNDRWSLDVLCHFDEWILKAPEGANPSAGEE